MLTSHSNLYTGRNSLLQNVLTWSTATNAYEFYGDIAPLLTKLDTVTKANFTGTNLYVGHIGMGSEAFSATNNVTFSMPLLSVDIVDAYMGIEQGCIQKRKGTGYRKRTRVGPEQMTRRSVCRWGESVGANRGRVLYNQRPGGIYPQGWMRFLHVYLGR